MGGNQKWFEKTHGVEAKRRFQAYDAGDDDSDGSKGWNPEDATGKGSRKADARDPLKTWHDAVKDLPDWQQVSLTIFRNNIAKAGPKYIALHSRGAGGTDDNDNGDGTDSFTEIARVEEIVQCEQTNGDTIILAFIQCYYELTKAGSSAPISKIAIVIKAISGWYITQEKEKGDFFTLSDDRNTLSVSIKSNERLFNPESAVELLD